MISSSPFTPKEGKLHYNSTSSLTNPKGRNDEINRKMSSIGSGRRSSSFTSTTTIANRSSPSSSSSSLMSSPFTPSSSSSVPFSWETLPGVPKQISNLPSSISSTTTSLLSLPLPPQLQCNSGGFLSVPRKKWSSYVENEESFVWDPFAVALVECSKGTTKLAKPPASVEIPAAKVRKKRRSTPSSSSSQVRSDRFGFGFGSWELYGSCKTTGCIVETNNNVCVPRTGRSNPAYGVANSRLW